MVSLPNSTRREGHGEPSEQGHGEPAEQYQEGGSW